MWRCSAPASLRAMPTSRCSGSLCCILQYPIEVPDQSCSSSRTGQYNSQAAQAVQVCSRCGSVEPEQQCRGSYSAHNTRVRPTYILFLFPVQLHLELYALHATAAYVTGMSHNQETLHTALLQTASLLMLAVRSR